MRSFILPLLGYAGYPMILLGGIAVFGLSSYAVVGMVSAQIVGSVAPAAASADFNIAPVEQIGSLGPARVAVPTAETAPVEPPESSFATVARPEHTLAVSVEAPSLGTTFATVEPPDAPSQRVGSQAVNVRAGPSKTAVTLGVLNAGSSVRVGEIVGGWVHVYFGGGDGWVYQSFLE